MNSNPLVWLPLTENFADPDRFAGEQNIAHIINIAMKYPLQKANENNSIVLSVTSLSIGVDGCKGGWVATIIKNGDLFIKKYSTMKRIVSRYEKFDEFFTRCIYRLNSACFPLFQSTLTGKTVQSFRYFNDIKLK